MKPNRRAVSHANVAVAALSLLLGACVAPVQAPVAAPPPRRALPPPSRPAAIPPAEWRDAPATPGTWLWSREGNSSVARFGEPAQPALLTLTCDARAGTVTATRAGPSSAAALAILTSSVSRTIAVRPASDGGLTATLAARDSLLDAMAYSRGRFAVKVAELEPLYLPSWPEVSRVIEDCR